MSDVTMHVSLGEADLYAGACLTYSGVPFHRIQKDRTSPEDQRRLDAIFDRFVKAKGELRKREEGESAAVTTSSPPAVDVVLSEDECELLAAVLDAVLAEHQPPDSRNDYDLQLHVAARSEVESALGKLKALRTKHMT